MDNNELSVKVQALNWILWEWVRQNIDHAIRVKMPDRIHKAMGVLGHRASYRGAPSYSGGGDFSPEFLRWIETPKAVRALAEKLDQLRKDDDLLYAFIILRAQRYTYQDLNSMGIFPVLWKPNRGYCKGAVKLNRDAIRFLLSIVPSEQVKQFDPDIREYASQPIL